MASAFSCCFPFLKRRRNKDFEEETIGEITADPPTEFCGEGAEIHQRDVEGLEPEEVVEEAMKVEETVVSVVDVEEGVVKVGEVVEEKVVEGGDQGPKRTPRSTRGTPKAQNQAEVVEEVAEFKETVMSVVEVEDKVVKVEEVLEEKAFEKVSEPESDLRLNANGKLPEKKEKEVKETVEEDEKGEQLELEDNKPGAYVGAEYYDKETENENEDLQEAEKLEKEVEEGEEGDVGEEEKVAVAEEELEEVKEEDEGGIGKEKEGDVAEEKLEEVEEDDGDIGEEEEGDVVEEELEEVEEDEGDIGKEDEGGVVEKELEEEGDVADKEMEEVREEDEVNVAEEVEDAPEERDGGEDDDEKNGGVEHAVAEMVVAAEAEEHHYVFQERCKRKEFEIFVGGLDRNTTKEDLRNVFGEVSLVTEVRLIMDPQTNKNKGFATVEQAKRVVTELKNPVINGKRCGVASSQDSDTLFLGDICKTRTMEALREKLKNYGVGTVQDLTLPEDGSNEGMNCGFAFLEFSSWSDAMDAFKRIQRRGVFGVDRNARVSFADSFTDPGEEIMAQVKTVFIDALRSSWDEGRVRKLLKEYGEVEKIELARNMPSVKRKDYGFVTFNNSEIGEGDKKVKVRVRLWRPLPPISRSYDRRPAVTRYPKRDYGRYNEPAERGRAAAADYRDEYYTRGPGYAEPPPPLPPSFREGRGSEYDTNDGYGGSGSSQDGRSSLYSSSRQGEGSYGSSDVWRMYSSSYSGNYISRGADVHGGSSYSSSYSQCGKSSQDSHGLYSSSHPGVSYGGARFERPPPSYRDEDDDQISERTSKILAAHHTTSLHVIRGGSKGEKRRGNNFTVALMVQLRDPLRNYEPVGTPMLVLIQVERVFGNQENDNESKAVITETKEEKVEEAQVEQEPIAQFKITQVHVTGLTTQKEQSGSRWLLAHGMGKSNKNPFLKSKPRFERPPPSYREEGARAYDTDVGAHQWWRLWEVEVMGRTIEI